MSTKKAAPRAQGLSRRCLDKLLEYADWANLDSLPEQEVQTIFRVAERLIEKRFVRLLSTIDQESFRQFLKLHLSKEPHEVFYLFYLDTQHRLIAHEPVCRGTIDSACVSVRMVVQRALHFNASACIAAHNHPSGAVEPSANDWHLTFAIREALAVFDIRFLDHWIVGADIVSMFQMEVPADLASK